MSLSLLEIKRLEVELLKIQAARKELEYKILEREEDILRIKEHIKVQLLKEKELEVKLKVENGD